MSFIDARMVFDADGKRVSDKLNILDGQMTTTNAQLADITINAKIFGAKGDGVTNDTTAIQNAINASTNRTCLIPFNTSGIYLVSDLFIPSNVTIRIESGVEIRAKSGTGKVLNLTGVSNVSIYGNGALVTMPKAEYKSEYNHAILISDHCQNIVIDRLNISGTGGDGITIGGSGTIPPSDNILLNKCIIDNARRNGLSIVHATNVKVIDCEFKNSNGTAPQFGVDIEPNTDSIINNITLENCTAHHNAKTGFSALYQSNNIRFTNCKSYSNGERGFAIGGASARLATDVLLENCQSFLNATRGFEIILANRVDIKNCSAKTNTGSGFYAYATNDVNFKGCSANGNVAVGFFVKGDPTTKVLRNSIDSCTSIGNYGGYYLSYLNKGLIINSICDSNKFDGINITTCLDYDISNCIIVDNIGCGVFDGGNTNLSIKQSKIIRNKKVGIIVINSSVRSSLKNNEYIDNGLYSDSTYKTNLYVHTATDTSVSTNKVRETTGNTTIGTYGIFINSSAANTFLLGNDCFNGGYLAGILINVGSTNTLNAGNRNKDGTYNTTAN